MQKLLTVGADIDELQAAGPVALQGERHTGNIDDGRQQALFRELQLARQLSRYLCPPVAQWGQRPKFSYWHPGIAEALLATAIGLVAAIPATAAYNKFATEIGRYGARLENFANDFVATLSRNLEDTRGVGSVESPASETGDVAWRRK